MHASLKILLNSVTEINPANIFGLHMYSSLFEGLPYGYIELSDKDGSGLAMFENFQIGTTIQITIVGDNNTATYKNYYVLQIEDDCSLDINTFGGVIRVWFGHPWFLYKDPKNHAYKPTNNGELIKKILTNEDRGMKFEIDDKNFDKTDDDGKIARYKICETDWDFINNKIVPYTSINQQPAWFFLTDTGNICLKSFKNLYSQNQTMMFTLQEGSFTDKTIQKMDSIFSKYGIPKGNHLTIQQARLKIGDREFASEYMPTFYVENVQDGSFLTGGRLLNNKTTSGKLLPLDANYMMSVKGTSIKVLHNRQITDGLSLLFQTGKDPDKMFTLTITSLFAGMMLTVGFTVEVFGGDIKIKEKDKTPWINGKWLVAAIEHYKNPDNDKEILSKTTLVRPTFNSSNSTLTMPELMYEAV